MPVIQLVLVLLVHTKGKPTYLFLYDLLEVKLTIISENTDTNIPIKVKIFA